MVWIWVWLMSALVGAGELEFGYSPVLERGQRPMFSVTPPRAVSTMWVQIEAGGKTYDFDRNGAAAGEELQFFWERNEAVTDAMVTVKVEFTDGYVEAKQVPFSYS